MLYFVFGFTVCYGIFATIALTKLNDENSSRESDKEFFKQRHNKMSKELLDKQAEIRFYKNQLDSKV